MLGYKRLIGFLQAKIKTITKNLCKIRPQKYMALGRDGQVDKYLLTYSMIRTLKHSKILVFIHARESIRVETHL